MLFPSTIITSNSATQTDNELLKLVAQIHQTISNNNPDLFRINQNTGWGIDVVRQIHQFLAKQPFNHQNKLVLIEKAHLLQVEAQNSLLKTLEEPGDNNYIILTTPRPTLLLPTILSRCHQIRLHQDDQEIAINHFGESKEMTTNLSIAEKIASDKESVSRILDEQLSFYHHQLVKNPSTQNQHLIERLIKCIQMINANVDPKSAIDYFFLT